MIVAEEANIYQSLLSKGVSKQLEAFFSAANLSFSDWILKILLSDGVNHVLLFVYPIESIEGQLADEQVLIAEAKGDGTFSFGGLAGGVL